jgi:GDP-L-fucose synthase
LAKKAGSAFIVKGTGKPLRQFIYSIDLAKLIMIVLTTDKKIDNITLSVSEEDEVSIETVAKNIARCFDYDDRIVFDSSYNDGQYKKTVSNEKILDICPNFEFTKIEDGIKSTVEWFMENFDKIRC